MISAGAQRWAQAVLELVGNCPLPARSDEDIVRAADELLLAGILTLDDVIYCDRDRLIDDARD